MDTQGDEPTKVVVRNPADVRREQAASQPDYAAQRREKLEDDARKIAQELVQKGQRNQLVHDDNVFSARVDLRRYHEHPREPLTQMVEGLLQEILGEDVELTVMVFDERSSYGGLVEDYDITVKATPRS